MEDIWNWLTGYASSTAIGVIQMPWANWAQLCDHSIESHGVLDTHRRELAHCIRSDPNFVFGPFNFVGPCLARVDEPTTLQEMVHNQTGFIALLPFNLEIPLDAIGSDDGQCSLSRCASAHTCCVRIEFHLLEAVSEDSPGGNHQDRVCDPLNVAR